MSEASPLLQDRYKARGGRVLLTGVQALVRLMLVQAELDRRNGLRTGGFVSGYRGSPLGGVDRAFAGAEPLVREAGVVVRPAVNEELAATAITGTQQIAQSPGAKVEGVFALWYGKGPGLDRASDAIRHGVLQGASPAGGVVVAIGDDHLCKSSSIVCASDAAAAALLLPLLAPSDAQELIAYGLHGFAVSRLTGAWTSLKILPELADATHTAEADEMTFVSLFPEIEVPPFGLHNRWPDPPLEQERRHRLHRLPAVQAYIRVNGLDRSYHRGSRTRLGVVAAGKSWLDLKEALRLLGLGPDRLQTLGIALYKPAMIWPLDPQGVADFARGLEAVVVIEEKGPLVEDQIKAILYAHLDRPRVLGKTGLQGEALFTPVGGLDPEVIAAGLAPLIARFGRDPPVVLEPLIPIDLAAGEGLGPAAAAARKPFFCSGCPHNRSTMLPEGSRALSGIGCHSIAALTRPDHAAYSQMGGEGVAWVGLSPFTDEPHVFANLGDGTYFHSGVLAIRQAVAAHVNITYKLLYNGAVAMTGGQALDGELPIERLIAQLQAEGVAGVMVVTDDPARYPANSAVRTLTERVIHRDGFETLQTELRARKGVYVVIYDQICATERRRLRKRGRIADTSQRVFINELVCDGCGDCSEQSNCLSVEPADTPFGIKRRINQSNCNTDLSCIRGFCPSFVSVTGASLRRPALEARACPDAPPPPACTAAHQRILVAGIGGTGVVTIGALLSMSAHLAGRRAGVLDQVGLAQKGGGVLSHIHLADDEITALRIPAGQSDLILVCDQVVGAAQEVLATIRPGHTRVVINSDVAVTSDFLRDRRALPDRSVLSARLRARVGAPDLVVSHAFSRLSEALLGDAIGSNVMMSGFACQMGGLSVDPQSYAQAVELNGTAKEMNHRAFAWGRRLAVDPGGVYRAAGLAAEAPQPEACEALIAARAEFLTAYQDARYAARFLSAIELARRAESSVSTGTLFTEAAARGLFHLMAYKDEYEVARLYADPAFARALAGTFEGSPKITFHFAPPGLARRDRASGELRKQVFGAWLMPGLRMLAQFKRLRGTAFDPFGYSPERRMERALIGEFQQILGRLAGALTSDNLAAASAVARLPLEVRGFGRVKARAIEAYHERLESAMAAFEGKSSAPAPRAMERA